MSMHIIMAVLSLALLIGAGPASAQATHTATVSVHRDLRPLSTAGARTILIVASNVLKITPGGHTCPVAFKLKGPVGQFGSETTPKVVQTPAHRDAVHMVDSDKKTTFHIKVVEKIEFCTASSTYTGCAWPTDLPSIIVVHPDKLGDAYPNHLLWVHEFGHLTGRSHRDDPNRTWLMTACGVTAKSVKVTKRECSCLYGGPEKCGNPIPKGCPP
jgi:hypothetical protein